MIALEQHREPDHADWREYAGLLSAAHKAFSPEIDSLIRGLPLARVCRVLDVPCGDGFYAAILARRLPPGSKVIAADLDKKALKVANDRAERLPANAALLPQAADVSTLPYENDSFDMVWCAQSLISLSEPEEGRLGSGVTRALREMFRVLRPGGLIALLEQDAMHHVLLPWPVDLELAVRSAERKGFTRLYGRSQQLDFGRHIGRLLAKSGFHAIEKFTLAAGRRGIPNGDLHAFLEAYFGELCRRVETDLGDEPMRKLARLIDPASGDSFFHDPDFEMTWLGFAAVGTKPQ